MATVGFDLGEKPFERNGKHARIVGRLNENLFGGYHTTGYLHEPVTGNHLGINLKGHNIQSKVELDALVDSTLSDLEGTLVFEGNNMNGIPYNRWEFTGSNDLVFNGGVISNETPNESRVWLRASAYKENTAGESIVSPVVIMDYVLLQDIKGINVHGGTFTNGAWRTRTLNNKTVDTANIATLSSNQVTLPAGTYQFSGSAPAYTVNRHATRLYDVTNAVVLAVGTIEKITTSNASRSHVKGRFTLTAPAAIRLEHRCESTVTTSGLGYSCTWANSVFAQLEFWKEP